MHPPIHPPMHPPIHPPMHPPIHPSMHHSMHSSLLPHSIKLSQNHGMNHPMTDDYNYYHNYHDYYYGSDHENNRFNRHNKSKTHRTFNRYKMNYNSYNNSNGSLQNNTYKHDFHTYNNLDYNNNDNNSDYYNNGNNNYAKTIIQNPYPYYNPPYCYQDNNHQHSNHNNYKNLSFYHKQNTTSRTLSSSEEDNLKKSLGVLHAPEVTEISSRSVLVLMKSCSERHQLQLREGDDGAFETVYSGDATEVTLRGLRPCTMYHVRVLSSVEPKRKTPSTPPSSPSSSFQTLQTTPDPPGPPHTTHSSHDTLSLRWNTPCDNGSAITSYLLEIDNPSKRQGFTKAYEGLETSFELSGLQPSTTYKTRVAALNSLGRSDFSAVSSLKTKPTLPQPPNPPSSSSSSPSSLHLKWHKRPGDESFVLVLWDMLKQTNKVLYTGSEDSFNFNNLKRNTSYLFKLKATNEVGESDWSRMVSLTTSPDLPSPITSLHLFDPPTHDSFSVEWGDPKDNGGTEIKYYIVQISDNTEHSETHRRSVKSICVAGKMAGCVYLVKVAAVNSVGQAQWSDSLRVQTRCFPPGVCGPPSLVQPPSPRVVQLCWETPSNAARNQLFSYEVLMRSCFIEEYSNDDDKKTMNMINNAVSTERILNKNETKNDKNQTNINENHEKRDEETHKKENNEKEINTINVIKGSNVVIENGGDDRRRLGVNSKLDDLREDALNTNNNTFINYKTEYKDNNEEKTKKQHFSNVFPENNNTSATTNIIELNKNDSMKSAKENKTIVNLSHTNKLKSLASDDCCSTDSKTESKTVSTISNTPPSSSSNASNSTDTLTAQKPEKTSSTSSNQTENTSHTTISLATTNSEAPITETELPPDCQIVYTGVETQCSVKDLKPGCCYAFKIRASNSAGVGDWSDELMVTTQSLPPLPPHPPVLTSTSPHSVDVTWGESRDNNGAHVIEYRLMMTKDDSDDSEIVMKGLSFSHTFHHLQPATKYFVRVQAVNRVGEGDWSNESSIRTQPSVPNAPVQLHASSTHTTITIIGKSGNDNGSRVTEFLVFLDEYDPEVSPVIASKTESNNDAPSFKHVFENLQPETVYRLRAQARNELGVGEMSGALKITTQHSPPEAPLIQCTANTSNSLKLKWSCPRNIPNLAYSLQMFKDAGFSSVYEGPAHCHRVTRLSEQVDYRFRICCVGGWGYGPYGDEVVFTTAKAPPPTVKCPKVGYITSEACTIEWTSVKRHNVDNLFYVLQMRTVFGKDQTFKEIYRGPSTSHRVAGLEANSEYRVRVCAVRQTKEHSQLHGCFSQTASFCTAPLKVLPKKDVEAAEANRIKTRWFHNISDQHWAFLLLLIFAMFAVMVAVLAQQLIYESQPSTFPQSTIKPHTKL